MTFYHIFLEKKFSPFLSVYIVFNLLFFIVSPLIQIDELETNSTTRFIQNFPYNPEFCIRINIYLLIFHIIFFVTYLISVKDVTIVKKTTEYKNIPVFVIIILFVSLVIVAVNIDTIQFQLQNEFYKEVEATSVSKYLLVQKFLFFIPFSGIILAHYYLIIANKKTSNHKIVFIVLAILLVLFLFIKNPLTEKRNALGPIYITFIFLFWKRFLDTNLKVLRFMFLSMVLLFPILTIITHSRYSLSQMVQRPHTIISNFEYLHVSDAFNSLHYDAYPNFLATVDYYDKKDVTPGKQLAGSILFFVPRKIWTDKPESTGFKIGNYLIDKYKFDFNNLSNPYISEGYINFGIAGVLIFPVLLAFFFIRMMKLLHSPDPLKIAFAFYTAIYMMYFLRGDLTNGIAYLVAAYFAMVLLPKLFIQTRLHEK
ncbi:MAG: O-antigen polymerase [Flavobacterium sp.]